MSQSIQEVQNEIIEEFSMLDGDMEMTIGYVMELGETLEPLEEEQKTDDNIVKGCQSKVWLRCVEKAEKLYFYGDSDALITKGLLALVVMLYSGLSRDEIMTQKNDVVREIGLMNHLSMTRANGLEQIVKKIKLYASKKTNYDSKN